MSKLYTGAEIVFKCMEDQKVEFIFGYPGGAVLPIYDELKNHNSFFLNNKVTRLQSFQLFDYYNWLPNNLLVKLDRCLMTYGMEGRTPLIDKKLFENFFFIKDEYKIHNSFGKFLIRNFIKYLLLLIQAFIANQLCPRNIIMLK